MFWMKLMVDGGREFSGALAWLGDTQRPDEAELHDAQGLVAARCALAMLE